MNDLTRSGPRANVLRHVDTARRVRGPISFVLVAGIAGLVACSSSNNSSTTKDGGADSGQGNDASNDSTTDVQTMTEEPAPTGAQGEACATGNVCDTGLYCAGGTCVPSSCAGKTTRSLPYNIATDFDTLFTIGPELDNLTIIASAPDCNATTFPSIEDTGIVDAGADASYPTLGDGGPEIDTIPNPQPSCYEFLYDPSCQNGSNGLCWAGVEFTNSAATAVASPGAVCSPTSVGQCIALGATAVSFWARASTPSGGTTPTVKFGTNRPGACLTTPIAGDPTIQQSGTCAGDTEFYIALTNTWTQYYVSIPAGEPYNDEPGCGGGVWEAFSVVLEPEYFLGGAYVMIKDIVWSNAADGYDAGVGVGVSDAGAPSDAGSDALSDAASDAASDALSDAASDAASDAGSASDATSDVVSDAASDAAEQ